MKLAEETLLHLLDIFRQGIVTLSDMSQPLRDLDLEERDGKLYVKRKDQTGR